MPELIPRDLPKGKKVVQEGRGLGRTINLGRTAWCQEKDVCCDGDYKWICAEEGRITWQMVMGLSSVDEEVDALRYLYHWGKDRGIVIDRCHVITDHRMGLPQDMWVRAPRGTSFMLESENDYHRIAQAAPIQPVFGDHHIGSPAAVHNTINALRAGAGYVGTVSHYYYNYPHWKDDVSQIVETVKALGIVAAKRRENIMAQSAMADAIPSQFMDHASIVGYARLEKYVVEELCGANYSLGYGNLTSNIPAKIATWLALYDILMADHNVISYINGNTIDATDDFNAHYAVVTAEIIPSINAELLYKTGVTFCLIPASEVLRVPTKEEIAEVHQVARVAEVRAREFREMIDFSEVNRIRALLVAKGYQFFKNIKKGLLELGIDITDPVQILLAVRRLGAAKLEQLFHPGIQDFSLLRGITPFVPTELIKKSMALRDEALKEIQNQQLTDAIRGKKIITGSTDTHEFGLLVVNEVLNDLGAKVINGGVDLDVEDVLDLASKEATPYLVISTHNGLCLEYAEKLTNLAEQRHQSVRVFMGGRLNAILEGGTEPVDVSDSLLQMGIKPCRDVVHLARHMATSLYSD